MGAGRSVAVRVLDELAERLETEIKIAERLANRENKRMSDDFYYGMITAYEIVLYMIKRMRESEVM